MQIALKQVDRSPLDNGSGRDCLENIGATCNQAVELFNFLNQELQDVRPIQKAGATDTAEKPAKRRWVRRKTRLTQLATQTTAITTSLTAALLTLRNVQASIAADEATTKIEDLLQKVISHQAALVKKPLAEGESDKDGEKQENNAQELGSAAEQTTEQENEESNEQGVLEEFVSAPSSPVIDASDAEQDLTTSPPINTLEHIPRSVVVSQSSICKSFCRCQCHAKARMQTPQWAALLLGHMAFYGNCPILLNRRACNKKRCQRSGATNMQLIYDAPAWTSSFFKVYVRGNLQGFAISMPRVIPDHSFTWRIVTNGNIPELRRWLSQGLASPYDVDANGRSLLMVSSP